MAENERGMPMDTTALLSILQTLIGRTDVSVVLSSGTVTGTLTVANDDAVVYSPSSAGNSTVIPIANIIDVIVPNV
jgi:hypothetical protein